MSSGRRRARGWRKVSLPDLQRLEKDNGKLKKRRANDELCFRSRNSIDSTYNSVTLRSSSAADSTRVPGFRYPCVRTSMPRTRRKRDKPSGIITYRHATSGKLYKATYKSIKNAKNPRDAFTIAFTISTSSVIVRICVPSPGQMHISGPLLGVS
jgi:hypothetical protein